MPVSLLFYSSWATFLAVYRLSGKVLSPNMVSHCIIMSKFAFYIAFYEKMLGISEFTGLVSWL